METEVVTKTGHPLSAGSIEDVSAAAALMRASWSENAECEFDYDAGFFQSCLAYPGERAVIAPALYDGGELAAIVLGMPRKTRIGNRERHLLLMTCLTVAPRWKGHGLGTAVWMEGLRRAHASGYDGAIHYCAEGNISNHVTVAAARRGGWEARPMAPVRFLRRLLKPVGEGSGPPPSVEDFLRAAEPVAGQTPLCRLWTRPEADWQLQQRSGATAVSVRSESGAGAITGYAIRSLDAAGTRCVMIEDVLWSELRFEECAQLLARFLTLAASRADMAVVPMLNYADMTAFQSAGFRKSPRLLRPYLTVWDADPGVDLSSLGSMYMDVL